MRSKSSNPLKVESLNLSNGSKSKLIIVNFTHVRQKVVLEGFEGDFILEQLNADSFSTAICNENWLDTAPGIKVNIKKGI